MSGTAFGQKSSELRVSVCNSPQSFINLASGLAASMPTICCHKSYHLAMLCHRFAIL